MAGCLELYDSENHQTHAHFPSKLPLWPDELISNIVFIVCHKLSKFEVLPPIFLPGHLRQIPQSFWTNRDRRA